MKARVVIAAALALSLSGTAADAAPRCESTSEGRPDHQPTGNRLVWPCQAIQGEWRDFALDEAPAWVVAHPTRPRDRWVIAAADGIVSEFRQGRLSEVGRLEPGDPPLVHDRSGALIVSSRSDTSTEAADRVPHSRIASAGFSLARLAGPTDRYAHGVLGDEIEASALAIGSDVGPGVRVELDGPEVIEGISAIAAELSDNGPFGFLVTVGDADVGARLRAYDEDGAAIAESDPIGQGYRWLHQIGVGPTGPGGEVEIIAVRTPHIGGVVEAYRLNGDRFERVAAIEGYSSHVLGSPNLDMALLADTDADGQLEVIVPTQDMTELAIIERTADGFAEVVRLPLDGRLATNVAAAVDEQGRLSLAAATDDGRLRIFR